MAELTFLFKKDELSAAFDEQTETNRVVINIPFLEDGEEDEEGKHELCGRLAVAHRTRGELCWANIVVKRKVEHEMVDKVFPVRVISAIENKKGYRLEVRFDKSILYT